MSKHVAETTTFSFKSDNATIFIIEFNYAMYLGITFECKISTLQKIFNRYCVYNPDEKTIFYF